MSTARTSSLLRLVNADDAPARPVLRPGSEGEAVREAAARVRRENVMAATLPPTDGRWLLAVQVTEALEGGRAAILRPERRRRLGVLATRLGVGAFDTSLVIAIVQDAARHGRGPLELDTASRLALVRAPRAEEPVRAGAKWPSLLMVAGIGAVLALCMARWITK